MGLMDEQGAMDLVREVLGVEPISAERMTLSHSGNVIFDVATSDGGVIARIREDEKDQFAGTADNLAAMAGLGLPVPRLLAVDTSRKIYPFAYMLLEKIPGRDLYYELPIMTRPQMTRLAEQVVEAQRKAMTLPEGTGYGWGNVGGGGPEEAWLFVSRDAADAPPPPEDAGTPMADLRRRLHFQKAQLQPYFRAVMPTCFLKDLTTKNIILQNGELQGFIDFDSVCFGDPLWMISLAAGCIIGDLGDEYGFYIDELRRLWNLTPEQNQAVTFYAAERALEFLQEASRTEDLNRVTRILTAIKRLLAGLEREEDNIPIMDVIFIHGAPGTGKSSLAWALQKRLKSPCFEFGWIPEFRVRKNSTISYEEEEELAFENLGLVLKNYVRRGFGNIIVTDLRDPVMRQVPRRFARYNYLLVTLWLDDDDALKARVLDETRSSGYRDWEEALALNREIMRRPVRRNEVRFNSGEMSVEALVEAVVASPPA